MTKAMTTNTPGTAMFRKLAMLLVAGLMMAGVATASEEGGLQDANVRLDDMASMQRGARLFFNYCSGCHSLQYLRYSRIAEDLQIDPKDVEKNFVFTGGRPLGLFTLPPEFKFIGQGSVGPIPFVIIVFVIFVLVFDFLLRRSTAFRRKKASSPPASRTCRRTRPRPTSAWRFPRCRTATRTTTPRGRRSTSSAAA